MFTRHTLALFGLLAFASSAHAQYNYSKDISRIFQAKCQQCHREGDVAPFALDSYATAVAWSEDIKNAVSQKRMPPWKPVDGYNSFRDAWGLNDEERSMIVNWVDAGMPEGDAADLPEPLPNTGEWALGDPDMIVKMPIEFAVPARKDTYRCFVIPTSLAADQYLSAIQYLPGNRQVVHHVIAYVDKTGASAKYDGKDGSPGYDCFGGPGDGVAEDATSMLGGWAPGVRARFLPDGIAMKLPKGSKIVLQVHYFANGKKDQTDQTKVGLYYSKNSVNKLLAFLPILNTGFKLKPGEENAEVTAQFAIPPFYDATVILVAPHMHLLGKQIKLEKIGIDKKVDPLIYINDWNFSWQGFYTLETPMPLPALSQLKVTCNFDNSDKNPKNPNNPVKTVGWGEGTEDEMCIGFVGVVFDRQGLPFVSKRTR